MNISDDDSSHGPQEIVELSYSSDETVEERVIDYLSSNKPEKLAGLFRQSESINAKALEVLAFMLDGKSDNEKLMRAHYPFKIVFKRWKPSRPRKQRTLKIPEKRAVDLVASMRDEGMMVKVAIPLVANQIKRTNSFVRAAWYASSKTPKPRPNDKS